MKFNCSNFVDIFELFHIYQKGVSTDVVNNTFERVINETKPSIVEQKITNLIKIWGFPPSKIVLGFLIGGPGGVLNLNANVMEAKDPFFIPFNEGCEFSTSNSSFTKMFDKQNQLVYMETQFEKENEKKISIYPTTRAIASYIKFAIRSGLAGVLAISIYNDDFEGKCKIDEDTLDDDNQKSDKLEIPKRPDNKFPFMRTIVRTIESTEGSTSSCTNNSLLEAIVLLSIVLFSILSNFQNQIYLCVAM